MIGGEGRGHGEAARRSDGARRPAGAAAGPPVRMELWIQALPPYPITFSFSFLRKVNCLARGLVGEIQVFFIQLLYIFFFV